MNTEIILKDMKFHAFHGVMEQENKIGGEFTVNLKLDVDFSKAMESDDITDTIDYGMVFNIVKEEMSVSSKLLEHVGGRIIKQIKAKIPGITKVDLELFKDNPPLSGRLTTGIHILN